MNFEQEFKENIYEPWRSEYVNYEEIQFNLKNQYISQPEFESIISAEADKVELFINRKQREIESRISYCERSLSNVTSPLVYETTDDALTEMLLDLNDLSKYTRYNFLALQKLINETKFDHSRLLYWLRSKSLDKQRFDLALVKIATLHDLCRLHGKARPPSPSNIDGTFEKAKFWVHPDNITELKAILLFHLPVVISNTDKPIEQSDSSVSSIYFDNPYFDLYQNRLQRDEGAEAIRCRWLGPVNEAKEIYIERKTHHAPWMNGLSVKDKVSFNVDQVDGFVKGTYTAEQYANDLRHKKNMSEEQVKKCHAIASGIQMSIQERELEPMMRVFYHRTVFQVPDDPRIVITLDTDVNFIREDPPRGHWRRENMDYPFDSEEEVYSFPYAIMETTTQIPPPEWLTRLLDSRLVYEVPRFSKYLQGVAYFWNSRLPLVPWWLEQLELDIRNAKQPTGNFSGLSRSKSLRPLIDGKYRMGYLESQLERSSGFKRTVNRYSTASRASNPFDDPIWSQHSPLSPTVASSISRVMSPSDGRRTTLFLDSASTDFLIGGKHTPRSSYLQVEKDEKEKERLFSEDITIVEEGRRNKKEKKAEEEKLGVEVDEEEEKPKKKKKKNKEGGAMVEPKIFFANERTFIHWLHFATILLSAAVTLLNFGDRVNRIVGAVFFGIAFLFSFYSFGFYRWRAHRIATKPHLRFDDIFGPVLLCILLIGALVLNFALRFNTPPQNNTYLGVNNTNSDL